MGLKKEDISGRRVAWLLLLEGCNKLKYVTKELRTFLPQMSVVFFPQKNWGVVTTQKALSDLICFAGSHFYLPLIHPGPRHCQVLGAVSAA